MLYAVQYDGEHTYVEAGSYGEAIALWREDLLNEWRAEGNYDPATDDDVEPEQVALVSEGAVLRAPEETGGNALRAAARALVDHHAQCDGDLGCSGCLTLSDHIASITAHLGDPPTQGPGATVRRIHGKA